VAASTRRLSAKERNDLLRQPLIAVVATEREGGGIHAVPVWFLYEREEMLVITDPESAKAKNVLRFGRATICVQSPRQGDLRYVTASGPARIEPASAAIRREFWAKYKGPKEAATLGTEDPPNTCIIVITPDRWVAWLD